MKTITFTLSNIRFSALSLLMVVGLYFASSAFAADITYAVSTGDWTDANWIPQAPVDGDNIIIPVGAVVSVSTDLSAIKLNSISVLGTLTIANSGSLKVEQTINVNPLVNVGGGVLTNNGTFSIKQTLGNSNAAINLSNGTDANATFINVGTLSIDMMASTISSSFTRCIYLSQTTATRTPRFTLGGTTNFSVPVGTRFFELGGGANAVIDGTAVIGSTSDFKNWRLIHVGNGGTLTLAGSLEFYSGYVSANGVISLSVTGTGSAVGNVVNSGTLKIHGMSGASGSYAIYFNAQRTSTPYYYGTAKFKNTGTIVIDGNYPTWYGAIFFNGNLGTTGELINEGTMTVTNEALTTAISCQIATTLTANILNSGSMTLNTAGTKSIVMGNASSTLTNTGTITVNKAITGYLANTTAATVNNNTSGVFNFNVADNAASAIDATNKILFTNSGGTISGRGVIGAASYAPSTGTIAPGGTSIGAFTFADATLALTGKLMMNATGTAAAGVDYDQVNSLGALDISGATLEFAAGYSAQNADNLSLVAAGTLTGAFSSVTKPANWINNYTATNSNLLYDTSTALNNNSLAIKIANVNYTLTFLNAENATCIITDITGRVVKSLVINNQNNSLSVNDLKGIYIVRISSEKGNFTQKVNL